MVSFTFSMRRHHIRLAQRHLPPSVWQSLVELRIPFANLRVQVCKAWQQNRTQKLRGVGNNSGPILSRLWARVHEIWSTNGLQYDRGCLPILSKLRNLLCC